MRFCEPVSVSVGGVLIVGGAFAGWRAFKINKRHFPVFGMVVFVPHLFHPDWVDVRINRQSLTYEGTMFLEYLIPR
jgi:hypothetical protein